MWERHTPSLETVWAEWEREKGAAQRRSARSRTPDNSEPGLKHPPGSISDLYFISDKVAEAVEKWGPGAKDS